MDFSTQQLTQDGEDEADGVAVTLEGPAEGERQGEWLAATHHEARVPGPLHQVEARRVVDGAVLRQAQVHAANRHHGQRPRIELLQL